MCLLAPLLPSFFSFRPSFSLATGISLFTTFFFLNVRVVLVARADYRPRRSVICLPSSKSSVSCPVDSGRFPRTFPSPTNYPLFFLPSSSPPPPFRPFPSRSPFSLTLLRAPTPGPNSWPRLLAPSPGPVSFPSLPSPSPFASSLRSFLPVTVHIAHCCLFSLWSTEYDVRYADERIRVKQNYQKQTLCPLLKINGPRITMSLS